jgi:hypothetical protein
VLAVTSQSAGEMHVRVPIPRMTYLREIMRSDSFDAIWPLFKLAADPPKELTESYAAMHHLRQWRNVPGLTVLHVGDGAHARTGALFAFMTKHTNISIDPVTNEGVVTSWTAKHDVHRFGWERCRIEDFPLEQFAISGYKVLVTFVHAHVDVDAVLARLGSSWIAAYTNACCEPKKQLGSVGRVREDWAILSPERRYKVITPYDYAEAKGARDGVV